MAPCSTTTWSFLIVMGGTSSIPSARSRSLTLFNLESVYHNAFGPRATEGGHGGESTGRFARKSQDPRSKKQRQDDKMNRMEYGMQDGTKPILTILQSCPKQLPETWLPGCHRLQ
jgi:hypothetical protein